MVSEPIELFGPKPMADEEQQPLIGLQKKLQEKKHSRNLRRLKYSCEEVYERMDNGLCIFCDELDTPGHHDLKHKGIQIFIVDCDDEVSEDKEEAHQETVKNPEPFIETKTNVEPETMKTEPFIEPLKHTSALQVPDSVNDVLLFHKMGSLVKEVGEVPQQSTNGNDKTVAHQLFDQMPLRKASKEKQRKYLKAWKFKFKPTSKRSKSMDVKFFSVEEIAWFMKDSKEINWDCVNKEFKEAVAGCEKKRVDPFKLIDEIESRLSRANHVWKPGGVPTEMDLWDWPKKESKSYQGSHQSFDRKKSNKTLYLEDEHEQKEVTKFISSWNNRVWEPGGVVLIEHDRWKELENCYKHGRLVRLMHWMSSMSWKETKSREFARLSACSCVVIKTWHCVEHETQQTDFRVWHRWKNKAEKFPTNCALLEFMMLDLVSFQTNKGNGVVGLVPKTIVLREVSHCRSNDYGTIRHKLLSVRDTSSDGYKEDSWSSIWFILKELCSARFERKKETIKKDFKELSKPEKDHKIEATVLVFLGHIFGIEHKTTSGWIKDQEQGANYEWSLCLQALQAVKDHKDTNYVSNTAILGVKGKYDPHGRLKEVMVQRQWETFMMMLLSIAESLILLSDPFIYAELETTLNDGDTFQKPLKDFYRACSYDYMALRVLELIKDKASRKRKLHKNWWFKYKLNTWLSEALHFWRKRKYEKLQRASEHTMCELIHKIRKACQCVVHETNETAPHVWYWWKTKAEIVQIVLKPIMHLKGKEETFSFKDAVTNCSSKTKISGHVLKQVFGRATHGLFLKQSLSQVLLHIQNRDCSFFGYMLMATSDCFGTLLEIPDKEIAKPHNIYVLKALILWKWYPPEQATWIFSELVQNSWDMSIFGKSRTWLLCKMRILHDLKDLRQFTRAGIKFHLKHKWRSKFGSNKLTRTWTRQKAWPRVLPRLHVRAFNLILEDKNVFNRGVL